MEWPATIVKGTNHNPHESQGRGGKPCLEACQYGKGNHIASEEVLVNNAEKCGMNV